MKFSNEAKVGYLIFVTTVIMFVFAWIIGIQNPFTSSVQFYVTYHFAGGIEVGSPVRVSGIKVGRVEKIEFFSPVDKTEIAIREPGSDRISEGSFIAPLKIKLSIHKDAALGVRKDSRFYINLAGLIGERYIEVTPGQIDSPQIQSGEIVAGIDPPRIDQLISQSFNLAGKIQELLEENKGDFNRSLELLIKLSGNLNKTLSWIDKSAIFKTDLSKLVDNLIAITNDFHQAATKVNSPEGEKTLKLLHELLWRLEPLDSGKIQQFLQKEGVKVKIF